MKCPDCKAENIPGDDTCQSCGASLYELSLPQARARDGVQKKIIDGTISELTIHDAVAVKPTDSVAAAVEEMRHHKIGCVVIMDKKKLVGICTERDLLNEVAGLKDPKKVRISDVMKHKPQTLKEDDAIAFAFHNMAMKGFRHIPIFRKSGKLGIITSRDLLRYLCE